MPSKKSTKSSKSKSKSTKAADCCSNYTSHGLRPSIGIIITLVVALIITISISVVALGQLKSSKVALADDKLALFDHLAESYIRDMDFQYADQPVYKQITGYGVSDEDGVFYITFDFAPYPTESISSIDELDLHHGIIYFQEDAEHGTYGHAFSYHEDDYHPGGIYYLYPAH